MNRDLVIVITIIILEVSLSGFLRPVLGPTLFSTAIIPLIFIAVSISIVVFIKNKKNVRYVVMGFVLVSLSTLAYDFTNQLFSTSESVETALILDANYQQKSGRSANGGGSTLLEINQRRYWIKSNVLYEYAQNHLNQHISVRIGKGYFNKPFLVGYSY